MKRILNAYMADISIRRKLMLLIMVICSVTLMATTTVFLFRETTALIRQQRQDLSALADILAKNSVAALSFNDPQSALETMRTLSAKTDIMAAYILRSDGTVFSRYLARNVKTAELPFERLGNGAPPEAYQQCLNRIRHEDGYLFLKNRYLSRFVPIIIDDQTIGSVVLHADNSELYKRLKDTALMALLIMTIAAMGAYLLTIRMQKFVSGPILHLLDTMRHVSDSKDFSLRADKHGNDEIGLLYDGFNEMLQEIQERDLILLQRQEHLQELAHFDTMTRLPNRTLFYDRLEQALHLAKRSSQQLAVMFLDLDHFKDINDTLGHRIGDLLLKQVADRMSLVLRDCDTVARLGGDEFTIFNQNIKSKKNACRVGQKLLDLFQIPYNLEGRQIYMTCSIGITLFPADALRIDDLMMNADIAMYHAKADGKNAYKLYDPGMNLRSSERVAMQSDLRKALDMQQFHLLYQPKYDALSGRINGVEALIRWQHPEQGLIMPGRFIPLAEETGIIVPITVWVLRTACQQAKLWHDAGYQDIITAVNLSACSLKRGNTTDTVSRILEETGLPPALLELELTESMLVENDHLAEEVLRTIKQLGVRFAIDDFGTGYSSLSYLHRFPIDALKIDHSFVWNMTRSSNDLAIVEAIIAMARSLHLQVIAEGVETVEQLETLKRCNCHTIQGYLFSRPVTAEELTRLLILENQ